MSTIFTIFIITITITIGDISNFGFIAVDVVVNAIDLHIVGEGCCGGADESEGQQDGA